jgi:hypothetical protein
MIRLVLGAVIFALLASPSAAKSKGVVRLVCTWQSTMTNTHNDIFTKSTDKVTLTIDFDRNLIFGANVRFDQDIAPIVEMYPGVIKWRLNDLTHGKYLDGYFDCASLSGWSTTILENVRADDTFEDCHIAGQKS